MSSINITPNNTYKISMRANNITSNFGDDFTIDASNSNINFRRNGADRMRITDSSSIFLNNVDLSANNLVNVNNLTVSRATPQTDASFNFTIVRISTDASARDIALPNPYYGQLCVLLNSNALQVYNNGTWNTLASSSTVTTLTVSGFSVGVNYEIIYVDSGNNVVGSPTTTGFTIYRFYPTTTTSGTISSNKTISFYYLLVAGGGGGGGSINSVSNGGGGGAGGLLTNYPSGSTLSLTNLTSYSLSVGGGGAGGNAQGTNGTNSTLQHSSGTLTAIGGGGGAYNAGVAGSSGGSGGGGSSNNEPPSQGAGGSGTVGQGFNGSTGIGPPNFYAGGGGGASEAGGTNSSGAGGDGASNNITGTSIVYAGGGGGGNNTNSPSPGGSGGGGNGGYGSGGGPTTAATAGTDGLGGGGGAGGYPNGASYPGFKGGAGVVVIRFPSYS